MSFRINQSPSSKINTITNNANESVSKKPSFTSFITNISNTSNEGIQTHTKGKSNFEKLKKFISKVFNKVKNEKNRYINNQIFIENFNLKKEGSLIGSSESKKEITKNKDELTTLKNKTKQLKPVSQEKKDKYQFTQNSNNGETAVQRSKKREGTPGYREANLKDEMKRMQESSAKLDPADNLPFGDIMASDAEKMTTSTETEQLTSYQQSLKKLKDYVEKQTVAISEEKIKGEAFKQAFDKVQESGGFGRGSSPADLQAKKLSDNTLQNNNESLGLDKDNLADNSFGLEFDGGALTDAELEEIMNRPLPTGPAPAKPERQAQTTAPVKPPRAENISLDNSHNSLNKSSESDA